MRFVQRVNGATPLPTGTPFGDGDADGAATIGATGAVTGRAGALSLVREVGARV